jgi:hypothetical protein
MADNLDLWNKLGKTAPEHTKKFARAGGFKGTAIKPIYTMQKMTEVFGPAGKGWGMGEPSFQTVAGSEGQVAVYCTVSVWWADEEGSVNSVFGVGGDMVVVKQSSGLRTDDEAFKKAFTDAVGNAMKHLGMSADVHMGLFDDSKYVQQRQSEEAALHAPSQDAQAEADSIETSENKLSKANARGLEQEMRDEIAACSTVEQLQVLWTSQAFQAELKRLPRDWLTALIEFRDECKAALLAAPPQVPAGYVPPDFDSIPPEARRAAELLRV